MQTVNITRSIYVHCDQSRTTEFLFACWKQEIYIKLVAMHNPNNYGIQGICIQVQS